MRGGSELRGATPAACAEIKIRPVTSGVECHAGRRVCVPDLKVFSHNELAKPGVLIKVVGRSRTM